MTDFQPGEFFTDGLVSKQARHLALLELAHLRQNGYQLRLPFADFLRLYQCIGFELTSSPPVTATTVQRILSFAGVRGVVVGPTTVFLKGEHEQRLTLILDKVHRRAARLTAAVRGFLLRRRLHTIREERMVIIRMREAEAQRVTVIRDLQQEALQQQAQIAAKIAGKNRGQRLSFDRDAESEFEQIDEDDDTTVRGDWSPQERYDAALRACGLYSAEAYRGTPDNICSDLIPYTKDLNRYINILPTLHSIVRLKTPVLVPLSAECEHLDDEGLATAERTRSRYINANFIRGYDSSSAAYIAAMGPTASTTPAFWQMMWDYGCKAIVMVTNLKERGQDKCHRYWPTKLYNAQG